MMSSSVPIAGGDVGQRNVYGSSPIPRNLYRLLAVVVHSGDANSGHFITYRRGVMRNSHRYEKFPFFPIFFIFISSLHSLFSWYHTSDTNVKEVSIDEVLKAPAYLIFYDRSAQRMMPR